MPITTKKDMIEYLQQAESIDKRIRERIIELLESEPPAVEFTEELKKLIQVDREFIEALPDDESHHWAFEKKTYEACDRINRLTAENEKLTDARKLTAEKFCKKCGCKMSLWCEKDVKERMDAKNSELQAENEKLTDAIESVNVDLSAKEERIKSVTEYLVGLIDVCDQPESDHIQQAIDMLNEQAQKEKENG